MSRHNSKKAKLQTSNWRFYTVFAAIAIVFLALIGRAAQIQVIDPDYLRHQGDIRVHRTLSDHAQRGMITDRNGLELAISVPVHTVWLDAVELAKHKGLDEKRKWRGLSEVLQVDHPKLMSKVENAVERKRRFLYLARHISPAQSEYVELLDIPGVRLRPESKRYYPTGEVSAHLVGITNIDGQGVEGIEKAYNHALTGKDGKQRILRDAKGQTIQVLSEQEEVPAQSVALSIDQRIQALAYQELKKAVEYHQANSGSLVMVDVETSEIIALVNNPSYNPNNRDTISSNRIRNRAVTDILEPGSLIKPLAVLAALEFGSVSSNEIIDTSPGRMRLGGRVVRDSKNHGKMTLTEILQKSSNVGVTKLALSMPKEHFLDTFFHAGFGSDTGSMIIGESSGAFYERRRWSDFELATLSFGYGLSVTPIQMAQMYTTLATGGIKRPLSILKRDEPEYGERVFSASSVRHVLRMMESVTTEGGTATAAAINGYRVAGKTGTSRIAERGGYGHKYNAVFGGIAPASAPKIATIVVINDPKYDDYHGGDVAAPVFGKVVAGALRLLNISPDSDEHNANEMELAAKQGGRNGA